MSKELLLVVDAVAAEKGVPESVINTSMRFVLGAWRRVGRQVKSPEFGSTAELVGPDTNENRSRSPSGSVPVTRNER